jgi:hypothetical protein
VPIRERVCSGKNGEQKHYYKKANGHAPENAYFPTTENRVNGYAPEKGASERACSGIQVFLLQFFVFSSCFWPISSANGQKKRGWEGLTFNLKLKCF